MKKIIILIPIFNDWQSLEKLINEINEVIGKIKNIEINCFVINDASTSKISKLIKPKFIKSIKILNMKENKGHARCNAFGIRYINQIEDFDYLILMDGDGEDRPIEIKKLINQVIIDPNISVVAERVKRSEGPFFRFLYFMHKLITYLFTGKKIKFGNFSCLTKNDVNLISSKASLWSSYSGTIKKNIKVLSSIDSTRGTRYFGPSKMSLYNLLIHSFSIIAVFRYNVLMRSILLILLFSLLNIYLKFSLIFFIIPIILFVIIIFSVSLREKEEELLNSKENLDSTLDITH
tara:strand:- start:386 stop:1258 length:873 start_codon:yes stop_codon:yes gene_type:complete